MRDDKNIKCAATQELFDVRSTLVLTHKCEYTTYRYEWRIEGYGWVQYADGSFYKSNSELGVAREIPCH